jgi:hypothetical protein
MVICQANQSLNSNLDVKILTHGMLKMRELFRDKTGIDITRYVTKAVIIQRFSILSNSTSECLYRLLQESAQQRGIGLDATHG